MTAPEDQNGLREALARALARCDGWENPDALWTDNIGVISRGGQGLPVWTDYADTADALIAGPLDSLIAERDEKCERLWGLWMAARDRALAAEAERDADRSRIVAAVGRSNDWREAARAAEAENEKLTAELNEDLDLIFATKCALSAAEAEITRLKEGMETLGAALKPFAAGADIADADCLKCFADLRYMDEQEIDTILPSGESPVLATLGDFRRARSALATLSQEHPHG